MAAGEEQESAILFLGGDYHGYIDSYPREAHLKWMPSDHQIDRYHASAVVLPDSRIFVVGGIFNLIVLNTTETFSPVTRTWSPTASMKIPRFTHRCYFLPETGLVYAVGGYDTLDSLTNTVEIYDPKIDEWVGIENIPVAIGNCKATQLNSGEIFFVGSNLTKVDCTAKDNIGSRTLIYSLITNTCVEVAPMNIPRIYGAVATLPNGNVLVAGGFNHGILSSSEIYDLESNVWTCVDSMKEPRHAATAVTFGSKVFICSASGLNSPSCTTEWYDVESNRWEKEKTFLIPWLGLTAVVYPYLKS